MVLVPVASAQWVVTVDADPVSTEFLVVAGDRGCITVLEGVVRAVEEFNGDSFNPLPPGRKICIEDGGILRISTANPSFVEFPRAEIFESRAFLSDVRTYSVGERSFVTTSPAPFWTLLAIVAVVAGIASMYIYLRGKRGRTASNRIDAIIHYVASNPGCTQKEIARALGLEKYQVSRLLARLEEEGRVVRVKRGISKRVYLKEQLQ